MENKQAGQRTGSRQGLAPLGSGRPVEWSLVGLWLPGFLSAQDTISQKGLYLEVVESGGSSTRRFFQSSPNVVIKKVGSIPCSWEIKSP